MKGFCNLARLSAVAGSLMVLPLLSGCGDNNPTTAPVSGTVTFNGEPLQAGTVIFTPKAGGPPAYGEIQSDGTYALTTFEDGDGAVPGSHGVAVSAVEFKNPDLPVATTVIPMKYSSEQTSGLTAEVAEQDMNVVDLEL
ncbi:hypothetical protein [Candidatus Laterigemmans baculatus]|uniref:hypothetical protein n=1 Tax=Candidatus Laterigemmans baculatus TaxID=2770505 RepID=UPI001F2CDD0C|nr:hypothetical protein [Candidatus Laterigemmans baculatus]